MGRISMPQGKGSQLHNRREYDLIGKPWPENIDRNRTRDNVTLVDIPLRDAYREIFGQAVDEYNAQQTRPERRIDDYMAKLSKSKNKEKLMYEDVVQWGSMEDYLQHPELWEIAKAAYTEYVKTFEARNPNLRLIGAYIHMDEASPHLHLDYIPVATGYKTGMRIRNSLDRAMKQMGIVPEPGTESRQNNATKAWKERERAEFGKICRSFGLNVEAEKQGRGFSYSSPEYGRVKDELRKQLVPVVKAELEMEAKAALGTDTTDPVQEDQIKRSLFGNRVSIPAEGYELLDKQAKAYRLNRKQIDDLPEREAAVERREQEMEELKQKNKSLSELCDRQEGWNASLRSKNDSLESENTALKAANASLSEENDNLKEKAEWWENIAQWLWRPLRAVVRAVAHLLKHGGIAENQQPIANAILSLGERTAQELERVGELEQGTSSRLREPSIDSEVQEILDQVAPIEPEQPTFKRHGPRL